ncbi:hypothetical protein Taro_038808 [Colocasia esculenta]|uniref:Uncharacterized protein n=1 Tax=Colocasia esculenta TaxID=4460 RepID=A0A843WTS4_COLES|nr:hypothetical protein [Colocasia esculenta]
MRRPIASGYCRGALPHHDGIATACGGATVPVGASGVSVARLCVGVCPRAGFALGTFGQQCGMVLVVLPRLFARCLALKGLSRSEVVSIAWEPRPQEPVEGVLWATSVLELAVDRADSGAEGKTRQSLVSLPLSAFVPEPRSGVRREVAAWPGCGVACVVCSVAALSRPCTGTEAGARLASRACGLRVPLLVASGGGLVAVVVTAFSSRHFQVFLVARACTVVIARLCLVSVGVVGLALGRPVLLVVPTSVFSRFRGPVLGCQPVMAPACVASRPGGVSGVQGGSACGPSTLCAERCFRFVLDSVGFCGSRVCCPTSVGGPGIAMFSSAA